MNDPIEIAQKRESVSLGYPLIAVTLSLIAIVTTFVLANSGLEFPEKIGVFSVIVAIFLAGCVGAYVWQKRTLEPKTEQVAEPEPPSGISAHDIDRGLEALDEANYFFSGSLKPSDTFRLVSNRVHDLLPFRSIELYLLNETRTQLRITAAEGVDVENQKGKTLGYDEGLAGQCYTNKRVEIDAYLMPDNSQKLGSSVAIPLCRGHEVFGVLQLSFGHEFEINAADHSVFAAVGTRASPMMLSALAFERGQMNALTDATTELPNERAFYLALENHLAESIGTRGERPLTVLAIDIKNFDEINQRHGHAAGDRVLNFAGQVIKENLRQMDFIARSIGDEFLAILPTATTEISHDIIARIHSGFFGRKIAVADGDAIEIELNVGWASIDADGDTASQLLRAAHLRKGQAKTLQPRKVAWFPQQFAN